jgi:hypothetical protein
LAAPQGGSLRPVPTRRANRYNKVVIEKTDPGAQTIRPGWLMALLAAAVVGVAGYALYSGGALEKAAIPGWLEFDFSPKPATPPHPVASRDFILGQWEVEQAAGANAAGTRLTYYQDGTLKGWETRIANGAGSRAPWSGTWSFEKLSDDTFRLRATINGAAFQPTFRIFDHDHIQNLDDNYIAVRVP